MCDECLYMAIDDTIEAEEEVERLERELANVKRVAAKWMRKALG